MISNIPIIPIILTILIPIIITSIFKNYIKKNFIKIFTILSFILSIIEISRVLFLLLTNNFNIINDLSLQLCFLYPVICMLAIITKKHYFYDYIASSSVLFGVGAILIFSYNGTFFTFNTINNYLFHGTIIFIGLMFKRINYTIPIKNIIYILIIFFTQLLIAYLVNYILGPPSNYIFLNAIFEPLNNIYHTETLNNFYSPVIFKYSISHYLTELKIYLGSINYNILMILVMTINYFIFILSFRKKKH